jgi:hypothetical protein
MDDTAPAGIECDLCHWVRITGLDPGTVIAAIFNAKRKDSIERGWADHMTPDVGRAWYESAPESGGSFPGFKHLDYVDFTAFKAFINEDWLEASFMSKEHSDDVVAALRSSGGTQ